MTVASALLKARNIGIRRCRNNLSRLIKKHEFLIITDRNNPESVLVPYNDMLEIVDVLDELQDKKTIEAIAEGRKAVRAGTKGISVSKIFKKRKKRKNK